MTTSLNVLCPVDFSEQSRSAVAYAIALADHFKAQLRFLTVVGDGECEADAGVELRRLVAPLAARVGRLYPAPEYIVEHGIPGGAILHVAAGSADLVVISTHGAGAASGPYGSTTLHVMRHTDVPLLVLPPALHELAPPDAERLMEHHEVVLAPVDFDRRALRDAHIAAGLADAFGLDLVLLHVVARGAARSSDEAYDRLRELSAAVGRPRHTETLVLDGDPVEQISRIARLRNAGVVVMGLRGDGLPPGAPPGSIAYAVLSRAPVLVLALPAGPPWISPRRPRDFSLQRERDTRQQPCEVS